MIRDNSASNVIGGLHLDGCQISAIRNEVTGNQSNNISSIHCLGSKVSVLGNRISGNDAGQHGTIFVDSEVVASSNLITGNTAAFGAGLLLLRCTGLTANNTIADNTGSYAAVSAQSSPVTIANNILVRNGGGIYADSSVTVRHNDVWGNTFSYIGTNPGTGDISADPRFTDSLAGRYDLRIDSPCLDAGDNALAVTTWTAFDGQPRIQGARVDMGAYEGKSPPRVAVKVSLARDPSTGEVVATVALTNLGGLPAASVRIEGAALRSAIGTQSGAPLPLMVGTLAPGEARSSTLRFPASAQTGAGLLSLTGGYSYTSAAGGSSATFGGSYRTAIP